MHAEPTTAVFRSRPRISNYHGHMSMDKHQESLTGQRAAPEASPGPSAMRFSREISAGEFKARCLALMDEVQSGGGEYIITKRGEPVAKLVPIRAEARRLLGSMKGTVKTLGDLITPLDEAWEAVEGWDDQR